MGLTKVADGACAAGPDADFDNCDGKVTWDDSGETFVFPDFMRGRMQIKLQNDFNQDAVAYVKDANKMDDLESGSRKAEGLCQSSPGELCLFLKAN